MRPYIPSVILIYVVTSGVKLDHWCKDELYEKYAIDLIRKGRCRNCTRKKRNDNDGMGNENEPHLESLSQHVSLNRAVWHIKDGKVSLGLFHCSTGKDMLSKLNDEQLTMIYLCT